MVTREDSLASAEQELKELGIRLPALPQPFGTYVEALQTGKLLFLSGMLPMEGHGAKFIGPVGAKLDVEAGRNAAHLAALKVLVVARQHRGRSTKRRGSSGSACRWPRREMSAISRKSPTPLRSYCKAFSKKTKVLGA